MTTMSRVVHFEIHADGPVRAMAFRGRCRSRDRALGGRCLRRAHDGDSGITDRACSLLGMMEHDAAAAD